jgi:hypothetical protein
MIIARRRNHKLAQALAERLANMQRTETEVFINLPPDPSMDELIFMREEIDLISRRLRELERRGSPWIERVDWFIRCRAGGQSYKDIAAVYGIESTLVRDGIHKVKVYVFSAPEQDDETNPGESEHRHGD